MPPTKRPIKAGSAKRCTGQVRVILNVENWSRFTMLDSQTDIHCGSVLARYQATNIYPGYREVSLGVGTEVFGGTCGTISWQVRQRELWHLSSSLIQIRVRVFPWNGSGIFKNLLRSFLHWRCFRSKANNFTLLVKRSSLLLCLVFVTVSRFMLSWVLRLPQFWCCDEDN